MIRVEGRTPFIHRSDTALVRRIDGERILLEARSGRRYRLHGVGARLWDLIEVGTTRERVLEQLGAEFSVAGHQLDNDVTALVASLERAGLVRTDVARGVAARGRDSIAPADVEATGIREEPHRGPVSAPGMSSYRKRLSNPILDATVRWLTVCSLHNDLEPPIAAPLDADGWNELVGFARRERIEPLLLQGLHAGLPGTSEQKHLSRTLARQAAHWDLSLEQVLLQVGERFDAEGIDWYVLKGLATARVLYPIPELRSTTDVDVLVHPSRYFDVLDLLRHSGMVAREWPAHGPASERHERSTTFVTPSGVRVDVHRWIQGAVRRHQIPTANLFDSWQEFEPVPGRTVRSLAAPLMVLHAMLHLGTGRPGRSSLAPLTTLTDLLWTRHRDPGAYRDAISAARMNGCLTPAAWADQVVCQWLSACGLTAAHMVGPTPSKPALIAYDRVLGTRGASSALQRLMGPEKLRRSWEAVFPSKEFRHRYGYSVVGQLGHVLGRPEPSHGAAGRSRSTH